MTGELGQLALCFALALALVMSVSGFLGIRPADVAARRIAASSAMGLLVFVALAFGVLTYAFIVSDLSAARGVVQDRRGHDNRLAPGRRTGTASRQLNVSRVVSIPSLS